jgi:hypothetical protein
MLHPDLHILLGDEAMVLISAQLDQTTDKDK